VTDKSDKRRTPTDCAAPPRQVLDEQLLGLILREPERKRVWRCSLCASACQREQRGLPALFVNLDGGGLHPSRDGFVGQTKPVK
jgi:hypothetical protein